MTSSPCISGLLKKWSYPCIPKYLHGRNGKVFQTFSAWPLRIYGRKTYALPSANTDVKDSSTTLKDNTGGRRVKSLMTLSDSSKATILELFGLEKEDVAEVSYSNRNGTAVLDIFLVPHYEPCPECGTTDPKIKNYVIKEITHSVLNDRKCIIRYHARRYVCPLCGRTYYEKNPFVFKAQKISSKTVVDVLNALKNYNETFSSVGRKYFISPSSVSSIFDTHVSISRKPLPEFLNFDEVYAFHSEGSKYVCVLLDYKTQKPVDILPSRRKDYLIGYLMKIPLEERKKVKACCFDMFTGYREAMKHCFPSSIGIVDHFHMSQELNRQLDRIRIRVMKGTDKGSDSYYILKKFSWILFDRPDKKADHDKTFYDPEGPKRYNYHYQRQMNYYDLREELLGTSSELLKAWNLRNSVIDFYDGNTADTAANALEELIARLRSSDIPEMRAFASTLGKWRTEIVNSFKICGLTYKIDKEDGHVAVRRNRMNNAIIENRNAIIKCIKKNANGYTNWDRFRNRVLYVLDADARFSLNPLDNDFESHQKEGENQ